MHNYQGRLCDIINSYLMDLVVRSLTTVSRDKITISTCVRLMLVLYYDALTRNETRNVMFEMSRPTNQTLSGQHGASA